jgi:hypothetical protein
MEQFNPSNPEYKNVEDLPVEEQEKYVNTEEGFVTKEAMDTYNEAIDDAKERNSRRSLKEKILGQRKTDPMDLLHSQAKSQDFLRKNPVLKLQFELAELLGHDHGAALPQIEKNYIEKILAMKERVGTEKDPKGLLFNVALVWQYSSRFPKELENKFSKEDIWKAIYLLEQDKDSIEEVALSSEEIADWLIFRTQTAFELANVLELEGLKGLAYDLRKYSLSGIPPNWPADLQPILLHAAKLIDKERPGKFN